MPFTKENHQSFVPEIHHDLTRNYPPGAEELKNLLEETTTRLQRNPACFFMRLKQEKHDLFKTLLKKQLGSVSFPGAYSNFKDTLSKKSATTIHKDISE